MGGFEIQLLLVTTTVSLSLGTHLKREQFLLISPVGIDTW